MKWGINIMFRFRFRVRIPERRVETRIESQNLSNFPATSQDWHSGRGLFEQTILRMIYHIISYHMSSKEGFSENTAQLTNTFRNCTLTAIYQSGNVIANLI